MKELLWIIKNDKLILQNKYNNNQYHKGIKKIKVKTFKKDLL